MSSACGNVPQHDAQQTRQVATKTPIMFALNSGISMPVIGLGVFQSPPEETASAVETSSAAGYRLIDSAASYDNGREVGEAIRASGIDRDDLFITTRR